MIRIETGEWNNRPEQNNLRIGAAFVVAMNKVVSVCAESGQSLAVWPEGDGWVAAVGATAGEEAPSPWQAICYLAQKLQAV